MQHNLWPINQSFLIQDAWQNLHTHFEITMIRFDAYAHITVQSGAMHDTEMHTAIH